MKNEKKQRLERAGWRVDSATTFLDLRLAMAAGVRQLRERRGLTQAGLAKQLGSSQSRVAKMEAADASVSLDLMIRSLLGIGAKPADIARIIRGARRAA